MIILPLKTFENLPPERQKEIIDVCLEEFTFHNYREASLTRIIKKLGLAKGSFYRYFESKKDLYAFLIEYGKRATFELFKKIFEEPMTDIIDAWVRFYLACARQDNAYPLLGYFGYKVTQDKNNPILGDVPFKSKIKGIEFLSDLFLEQQKQGRLRGDVDVDLLIFLLIQIQDGFLDYLRLKYDIDFEKNIKERRPFFPLEETVLKMELESYFGVLRNGFFKGVNQSIKGNDHAG